MRPRILLTGKSGQVGSALLPLLQGVGEVIAPGRHELDLLGANNLRRAVRDIRPELIINAAAYTAVDAAETDQANAGAINADAPALLAEEGKKIGAALVHYSTDYVFDGLKEAPYVETDPPHPINVYGQTKLAGEEAIRRAGIPHLIFRTSWVYATRGRNFLLSIIKLATQREELRIVRDQSGAPTWSREVAEVTVKILTQLTRHGSAASTFSQVCGIYHLTAAGETTWYDFAIAIIEEASRTPYALPWFVTATEGRPLVTRRIIPITTREYRTAASRPAYSVLSNSLLTRTFGVKMQDWRAQLCHAFAAECAGRQMAVASEL
jgi:dTDP-4-dehydrorhamnose reductase